MVGRKEVVHPGVVAEVPKRSRQRQSGRRALFSLVARDQGRDDGSRHFGRKTLFTRGVHGPCVAMK